MNGWTVPAKDICLLDAKGITGKPAQLGEAVSLKVGDSVYAVGAPQGLELSLSNGIVAQLRGELPPLIQTNTAISPGSSGGGLFDEKGRLVGLTTLQIEGGQSLNFAMPVEWIGEIKPDKKNYDLFAIDLYHKGIELSVTGKLQEAHQEVSSAIRENPQNALAYVYRAHLDARLGNYELAINDSSKAIEINSHFSLAYVNRAYVYYRLRDYEKCLEDAKKAIKLNSNFALAYILYGGSLSHIGSKNYQDALENIDKAIKLSPNLALAYMSRGAVQMALGNRSMAYADIRRAMELDPNSPEVLIAQGACDINFGNLNDGLNYINKAIELDPYLGVAYCNRAIVYLKMKRYFQAVEDSNKAIGLCAKRADVYAIRGAAYHGLGNEEQAMEDLKTSARLGNEKVQDALRKQGIQW